MVIICRMAITTPPWFVILAASIHMLAYRTAAATEYDAIVIGAGAGGCALAQTLIENEKHVLMLERGGEPNADSRRKETAFDVLVDNDCIEVFDGKGAVLATGNCLGGATTYNQGVWIEEIPDFLSGLGPLFSAEAVEQAYAWARTKLAPVTKSPPGSPQAIYNEDIFRALESASGIPVANVTPGTFRLQLDGSWRAHSIFDSDTKIRKSAEFLLDRSNPLLELKLGSEVRRILFDSDTSTAHCVKMKTGGTEKYCVKAGGRIYLSAGAIHTPRLLVESGIGPDGTIYNNKQVGKNLSDKPLFITLGFFQPGFFFDGEPGMLDLVASKTELLSSGNTRLGLVESLVTAKDGDLIDFARFERVFLSRSLRFSFLSPLFDVLLGFCDNQILNDGLFSFVCAPFLPFYNNGCTANANGIGLFLADPSSTGEVRVNRDGSLSIDPGYLSSEDDTEGMGAIIRRITPVYAARTGPSAPAQPGSFCPDFFGTINNLVSLFTFSFDVVGYSPSQVNPPWLQPDLEKDTNLQIGDKARQWVVSPHHFAGTASLGKVVDDHFKVLGVNGLYVADASVLPKTPRVNTMASIIMIGRLAGLDFPLEI